MRRKKRGVPPFSARLSRGACMRSYSFIHSFIHSFTPFEKAMAAKLDALGQGPMAAELLSAHACPEK